MNCRDSHASFVKQKFIQVSKFIPEGSRVLDIGCHDGKIRDFLKDTIYYGVDINKEQISELAKKRIKAKQADLNKDELPFKNEKFDFILLLDILEHVVNPQKLLLDSKSRLNREGKLIVSLPNDYHILNKIRFLFNKHLTENPFAPYGHLHYFPIKSGERFLTENGFEVLESALLTPIRAKFLAILFPQEFVRDVIYLLKQKD